MSFDSINLEGLVQEHQSDLREKFISRAREAGMGFVGLTGSWELELIHISSESAIKAKLTVPQMEDPELIKETFREMKKQLVEAINEASKSVGG